MVRHAGGRRAAVNAMGIKNSGFDRAVVEDPVAPQRPLRRSLRSPELQRRPRTGISLKWNRRRRSGIQEEGMTPPPRAWPAAYPGPAWRQGRSPTLSRRVHPFTVYGERPLPNGEIFEFQPALERLCGPDRARRPNR